MKFSEIESQLDPNFVQPYTFTSREFDPQTGLYYYRARTYDVAVGRFLQEDPLGFAGGDLNLFVYVANRPLSKKDPFGLAPCNNGEDCRRKLAECMTHTLRAEIACQALVAAGAITCYAAAGLACAAAGPAYPVCFATFVAKCTAAAQAGLFVCTSILTAETAHCWLDYQRCLKNGG